MTTTTAEVIDHADVEHMDATGDNTQVDVASLAATLVDIDPRALAANPANVRTNLGDLGPLAASIAAVGVLEPLVVIPDGDGGHRIVAGHRRNAAAIEAELTTVPCLVRPDLAAADATAALVAMIVENSHRLDLSAQEPSGIASDASFGCHGRGPLEAGIGIPGTSVTERRNCFGPL